MFKEYEDKSKVPVKMVYGINPISNGKKNACKNVYTVGGDIVLRDLAKKQRGVFGEEKKVSKKKLGTEEGKRLENKHPAKEKTIGGTQKGKTIHY